jgi:hypothetical protein
MRFQFQSVAALPPLAWCARLDNGQPTITVVHGPAVEADEHFFVEGVWDGPFEQGSIDETCLLMGSGGKIAGDRVIFATPCHPLERLHVVRRNASLLVSNSLPFLLAAAGLQLDPKYPHYKADLWSTVYGIDRYVKRIPTTQGVSIRLFCYTNVVVGADMELRESPKLVPPAWNSFADYRSFLHDALAALRHNAAMPRRQVFYDLLSTISSGYDSAAAAALAAEIGCKKVLTFRTGDRYLEDGEEVDDSGASVGRSLGLSVEEFSRSDYLRADPQVFPEFAACGDSADLQLSAFAGELRRKLFFTGFGGDLFWDRSNRLVSSSLVRDLPPNGDSLGEFRLRLGFIHVPVPYFSAIRHPALHAISNAPEMRPWTLGNDYDRPIPRRILEELGVPRRLFGQSKKGSFAAVHYGRRRIRRLAAFEDYYQRNRRQRSWLARAAAETRWLVGKATVRWTQFALRHGLPTLLSPRTGWDFPPPGRPSFVVAWGNTALSESYQHCIGSLV